MLRKILESYGGQETSISDEKIRKEAKVPPVHVLIMGRRLQLAARISRGAPPALFALLQRDRSQWDKQVLVDLCYLREIMRSKLGTMPPPPVEPEAWEHPDEAPTILEAIVAGFRTKHGSRGGGRFFLCEHSIGYFCLQ